MASDTRKAKCGGHESFHRLTDPDEFPRSPVNHDFRALDELVEIPRPGEKLVEVSPRHSDGNVGAVLGPRADFDVSLLAGQVGCVLVDLKLDDEPAEEPGDFRVLLG